ncbi:MAG: hypothetical protein RLY86_4413 [Pseudomonadota bacterium]|jgi:very-short-patch-repair endonuclease
MSISFARQLRVRQTAAERRLWAALRNRQVGGLKFRRQVPIGPYIADFVCHDAMLVVEADGSQHGPQEDACRTAYLQAAGFTVIRFWNPDILAETEACVIAIARAAGLDWSWSS